MSDAPVSLPSGKHGERTPLTNAEWDWLRTMPAWSNASGVAIRDKFEALVSALETAEADARQMAQALHRINELVEWGVRVWQLGDVGVCREWVLILLVDNLAEPLLDLPALGRA